MKYGKLTLGQIEAGINKIGGEDAFMRLVRGELTVSKVVVKTIAKDTVNPELFLLTVDYTESLEEMIAAGHYDWINDCIIPRLFPIEGTGVVEFEARYFRFSSHISPDDVIREMKDADTKNPWYPAKTEHVLSHGKRFPDEQRKFTIAGFGSVAFIHGFTDVLSIQMRGSERTLNVRSIRDDRRDNLRLLAVRQLRK